MLFYANKIIAFKDQSWYSYNRVSTVEKSMIRRSIGEDFNSTFEYNEAFIEKLKAICLYGEQSMSLKGLDLEIEWSESADNSKNLSLDEVKALFLIANIDFLTPEQITHLYPDGFDIKEEFDKAGKGINKQIKINTEEASKFELPLNELCFNEQEYLILKNLDRYHDGVKEFISGIITAQEFNDEFSLKVKKEELDNLSNGGAYISNMLQSQTRICCIYSMIIRIRNVIKEEHSLQDFALSPTKYINNTEYINEIKAIISKNNPNEAMVFITYIDQLQRLYNDKTTLENINNLEENIINSYNEYFSKQK